MISTMKESYENLRNWYRREQSDNGIGHHTHMDGAHFLIENKAQILKSLQCHDDLLEALRSVVFLHPVVKIPLLELNKAKAAIAKAERENNG